MNHNRSFKTCAFSRKKFDITSEDSVVIISFYKKEKVIIYVLLSVFFEKFANQADLFPLPGLRPCLYKKNRHIRFVFDGNRFGENLNKWSGTGEKYAELLK